MILRRVVCGELIVCPVACGKCCGEDVSPLSYGYKFSLGSHYKRMAVAIYVGVTCSYFAAAVFTVVSEVIRTPCYLHHAACYFKIDLYAHGRVIIGACRCKHYREFIFACFGHTLHCVFQSYSVKPFGQVARNRLLRQTAVFRHGIAPRYSSQVVFGREYFKLHIAGGKVTVVAACLHACNDVVCAGGCIHIGRICLLIRAVHILIVREFRLSVQGLSLWLQRLPAVCPVPDC